MIEKFGLFFVGAVEVQDMPIHKRHERRRIGDLIMELVFSDKLNIWILVDCQL